MARGNTGTLNVRRLVIDDDKAVRVAMLHLLRNWGCECKAVESIEEALTTAHSHTQDVVISDYRLRKQRTGAEANAALRTLLGNALPVLLITGDKAPERLREAQASGIYRTAQACLAQPSVPWINGGLEGSCLVTRQTWRIDLKNRSGKSQAG